MGRVDTDPDRVAKEKLDTSLVRSLQGHAMKAKICDLRGTRPRRDITIEFQRTSQGASIQQMGTLQSAQHRTQETKACLYSSPGDDAGAWVVLNA